MTIHDCEKCHMKPGSDTANEAGCLCAVLDNARGHNPGGWMVVRADCPLHGNKRCPGASDHDDHPKGD